MKTIKKQIKNISLVLVVLMLFQSCKVYHGDSVTLEQAVKEGKETKIVTSHNETLKFRSVVSEDGNFFGVKKIKGESIKTPIDVIKVKKVKILDKSSSTIATVLISAIVFGGVVFISTFDFPPYGPTQ